MIICENCIEEMKLYRKCLGYKKIWFKCPKCGAIERKRDIESYNQTRCADIVKRREKDNLLGGKRTDDNI